MNLICGVHYNVEPINHVYDMEPINRVDGDCAMTRSMQSRKTNILMVHGRQSRKIN
ncbi:MAG: hypothetical protein H8D46_00010 [FCB group bacterium]|nr:hypothetical protein [FCB group bacterium]